MQQCSVEKVFSIDAMFSSQAISRMRKISEIYEIDGGYYMTAWSYEISLRVLQSISRVSEANE